MLARMPPVRRWALDTLDSALAGALNEGTVELGRGTAEGDVGNRARRGFRGGCEDLALVEQVVEQRGLLTVDALHSFKPALLLNPAEHLAAHIDAKGVGRVHHRAGVGLAAVAHVAGTRWQSRPVTYQVVTHNDHGHTGDASVFLSACIDEPVALHVKRR